MKRTCALSRGALLFLVAVVDGCGGAPPPRAGAGVPRPSVKPAEQPPPIAKALEIPLPLPEDPAPAVAACRGGDAKACARAAQLYFDGWGVPRDMIRVAVYGGLACSARQYDACTLRDLSYLVRGPAAGRFNLMSGVKDYATYVVDPLIGLDGPFCINDPSRFTAWGWAAYVGSICGVNEARVHGREAVESACFADGDTAACRGLWLRAMLNWRDTDIQPGIASICRQQGALCDVAIGDTDEETVHFREKACLSPFYDACNAWSSLSASLGRPFDALTIERLWAQGCLHPEGDHHVPLSVGQRGQSNDACALDRFPRLAASRLPGDQALLRALAHTPELLRAADCVHPLYEATECGRFALGQDQDDDPYKPHVPEEQRWKERMEVLAWMCENPPPSAMDKLFVSGTCHDRKRVEGEYKTFLAQQARKKSAP